MRRALESLPGYRFEFLTRHSELVVRLSRDPPELVLNLCDAGLRNVAAQELHVAALLEVFGVPYSGAGPAGMVLCYDRSIVRMVAKECGVPLASTSALRPTARSG
jgi:D-alanine-D-alanine ligase